jgi:predicted histone-like DNA-binding protein
MALKVKAKQKLQKVGKYAETYRFVLSPELYIPLAQNKVISEAALRSGISKGVMQACWDAAGEVIKAWATEGHSVALPGLGTMRFGLRAKSVATVDEVKSKLIKSRKIIFTPSTELKDELSNTSVQITCYDKDGNVLKRVTSADDGVVEDNEGDDTGSTDGKTDGSNENENENENQNGGSTNPEPGTVNPEPGNGGGGGTEDGTDES